jgi:hypothetical protein
VSKILNHVEKGVTATYARHSYDAEKQRALELWGQRVQDLVRNINGPRAAYSGAGSDTVVHFASDPDTFLNPGR